MLDFSNKTELAYLAELARAFHQAVGERPYFLAGATARDLLLEQAHDINPGRNTRDVDLAVMVADWTAFEQVRSALIEGGQFTPVEGVLHKLYFKGIHELDLIPFGAIEQSDRTIAWPPDGEVTMGVFGFQEAYGHTLLVQLPGGESMRLVSLPALVVLKLIAWEERRRRRLGTDAHDIAVILRRYLDAGNQTRLYTDAAHLVESPDFDYEEAGAWLLGHDMAQLLPRSAHSRLANLLNTECDVNGPLNLIGDMRIDPERGLSLLQSLAREFRETSRQ